MLRKLIYSACLLFFTSLFLYSCQENDTIKLPPPKQIEVKKEFKSSVFVETYPNGQKKIKGQFKNGLRDSLWVSYYPNGVKQSENFYSVSLLNGNSVSYYENGDIRYRGFYLEGKKHGKWILKESNDTEKVIWYEHGIKK